jgi:hypothetical protein
MGDNSSNFLHCESGTINMAQGSASKDPKASKTEKKSAKKLDFLLDTIDTEVANLADVVDPDGPILDDKASNQDGEAISLDRGNTGMDSLELDMDFFKESPGTLAEEEPADNQAQAALDAMSDAEGEVEAMLAKEETASDPGAASANLTAKKDVDQDLAKALDELLATREVDASKLLKRTTKEDVGQGKEPAKAETVAEQLPEDLFDDLDKDLELVLDNATTESQVASEEEPAEDLLADLNKNLALEGQGKASKDEAALEMELSEDHLGDLEMDVKVEKDKVSAIKKAAIEAGLSKDLLETSELYSGMEGKVETAAEVATSTSNSDEDLADLLSKKIEALVNRLVEERLSEIAERVIMEKINKIFSSMK